MKNVLRFLFVSCSCALFFSGGVCAEKVLDIGFTIAKDDSVSVDYLKVKEGYPTKYFIKGDYLLRVFDSDGVSVYDQFFGVDFYRYSDPLVEVNESSCRFRLPYKGDMSRVYVLHGNKLIFSDRISLCDDDGICGESESYVSCPGDCPLGGEDGICRKAGDGFCDPDCLSGLDPDCSGVPTAVSTPSQNQGGSRFYALKYVAVVVLVFLSAFFYLVYRRRKSSG